MKVTSAIVLAAGLATVAAEFIPQSIEEYRPDSIKGIYLSGDEALSYLFDYNTTRPHSSSNVIVRDDNWRKNSNYTVKYKYSTNYDSGYLDRICLPRFATGEANSAYMNSSVFMPPDLSEDEPSQTLTARTVDYPHALSFYRGMVSGSQFPCERMDWIQVECGLNPYDGRSGEPVSFADQNKCLCKSDYYEALRACSACYDFHIGNATHAAEIERQHKLYSSALCVDAAAATRPVGEIYSSAHGKTGDYYIPPNSTIVKDGAPGKTDVTLYYTGNVDFVPATIQEPAFTRTVGNQKVVMTPGTAPVRATGMATGRPGSQAAAAATSEGGAATSEAAAATSQAGAAGLTVEGGLAVAMFGALMML